MLGYTSDDESDGGFPLLQPSCVHQQPENSVVIKPVVQASAQVHKADLSVAAAILGGACRSVDSYEWTDKLGRGSYGVVHKARCRRTSRLVALKEVTGFSHDTVGFSLSCIREVFALYTLRSCPQVVELIEVVVKIETESKILQYEAAIQSKQTSQSIKEEVVDEKASKRAKTSSGDAIQTPASQFHKLRRTTTTGVVQPVTVIPPRTIYLVQAQLDGDLKRLQRNCSTARPAAEAKYILRELLLALNASHAHGIVHRDLKPANILIGVSGEVCLADWGSARQGDVQGTVPAVTLWYRPPELLLGSTRVAGSIDMWSVGCIFAELLLGKPLFPCTSEMSLLGTQLGTVGIPQKNIHTEMHDLMKDKLVPKNAHKSNLRDAFPKHAFRNIGVLSDMGYDLQMKFLAVEPNMRISAKDALAHEYFQEAPLPMNKKHLSWVETPALIKEDNPQRNEFGEQLLSEECNTPQMLLDNSS